MQERINLKKIRFVYILLIGSAILLLVFLVRWQIVEASRFKSIADSRTFSYEINSLRGSIYSSDGTTLAFSEPRFDLYVWMNDLEFLEGKNIQTRSEFISKISKIIEISEKELEELINNAVENYGQKWILIQKDLTNEQWEAINSLETDSGSKLRGFSFINSSKRIYPENELAAHIVGLTNVYEDKLYGVGGIEGYWDGILNPIKGFVTQENDALGRSVATALLPTIEPKSGSAIYTSIDKKLQSIVEEKIKAGVERFSAESGTVIIMDPKTGKILALANYPTYDPNTRIVEDPKVYGNIAVSSPFESGSVGKGLTISAAVDLGKIKPDDIVMPNGHNGCEEIHNELLPLCTWDKKPQPPMSAKECFRKSDNICFYHISKLMKPVEFYSYLDKFGVGKPSGIDLSGESFGFLTKPEFWNEGDIAAFSYGHGYQLNVVQVIESQAAIANFGIRMKPFVVSKIVDSDGNINEYNPVVVERVISEDTANIVTDMMYYTYTQSIYDFPHLSRYKIGIKTGTALIATSEGYTDDINSSMIGFDASPLRTFIMLVKLERPQGSKLSFYDVRPVWLETFDAVKDHLGVPTI